MGTKSRLSRFAGAGSKTVVCFNKLEKNLVQKIVGTVAAGYARAINAPKLRIEAFSEIDN